jgi:hypothetical protein
MKSASVIVERSSVMGTFNGRYKDEKGNWQEQKGGVDIRHYPGGYSKFNTGVWGTGEVKWENSTASGPLTLGDKKLRFVATATGAGRYSFKTYDEYGNLMSEGTVEED